MGIDRFVVRGLGLGFLLGETLEGCFAWGLVRWRGGR